MFWVLDSMFLANERCFVSLYNCVTNANQLNVKKNDLKSKIRRKVENDSKTYAVNEYSMNFVQFRELKRNNWWYVLGSYTNRWFYIALIILTIATFFGLKAISSPKEISPLKVCTLKEEFIG
tara:strand:- start:175 stop:540 length:366 start_codon:yes stop_codon:yes gene_type:complete